MDNNIFTPISKKIDTLLDYAAYDGWMSTRSPNVTFAIDQLLDACKNIFTLTSCQDLDSDRTPHYFIVYSFDGYDQLIPVSKQHFDQLSQLGIGTSKTTPPTPFTSLNCN